LTGRGEAKWGANFHSVEMSGRAERRGSGENNRGDAAEMVNKEGGGKKSRVEVLVRKGKQFEKSREEQPYGQLRRRLGGGPRTRDWSTDEKEWYHIGTGG